MQLSLINVHGPLEHKISSDLYIYIYICGALEQVGYSGRCPRRTWSQQVHKGYQRLSEELQRQWVCSARLLGLMVMNNVRLKGKDHFK